MPPGRALRTGRTAPLPPTQAEAQTAMATLNEPEPDPPPGAFRPPDPAPEFRWWRCVDCSEWGQVRLPLAHPPVCGFCGGRLEEPPQPSHRGGADEPDAENGDD